MENLLQSTSLVKRAYWLVRLRWVAIALLAGATFVATRFFGVSLPTTSLYIIVGVLVLYNFFLFDLLNRFIREGRIAKPKTIGRIITFQISADLFILVTILHYSGGIENPFFFFFVFHMIIASILLSKLQSYLQATLAVFLFGLLVLFEYLGVIAHYVPEGFMGHSLYSDKFFVFVTFSVFSTTLYLVVYMTTSISEQLRKQQQGYEEVNLKLSEKDQLKNEYVLRLTHDIKGHLAAIQSCLNIVVDRMVGQLNEKQTDLIERAHRRASKCMAFITALLKLTRMRLAGNLEMHHFPLRNAVFNAFASMENRAKGKSISLDYNIEPSIDEVYGEPVLIEEAITNFLVNAIRYTPEKGAVRLNVKNRSDDILLEVTDTGIGIPEGELNKIFDEFYRAANARSLERDGTGLGLSIVKQVVEIHGGRVWAQNNQGGGSTFSFTLPKIPAESDKE
jgi:signal transduction histidine kinase